MSALLRAELLKLRTTRTFAALVGSALSLSLLVVVLTAILEDGVDEEQVRDLFTADFTSLFILLLGVMGMAGEWRHRTITSSVLAAPDRVRLLAAKTIAYAMAGALLSLIVTVTIMVVGTVILSARGETTADFADLLDVLWRNLTVAALLGAFGVGIGALLRNQIAAIIGVLVLAFVLEPTLVALAPDVGRFGPTSGAPNAILGFEGGGFDDEGDVLAPGAGVAVLLGWIGAAFAAGAALLRARDLT
jgi:ABC-2 type transport system permease protein